MHVTGCPCIHHIRQFSQQNAEQTLLACTLAKNSTAILKQAQKLVQVDALDLSL